MESLLKCGCCWLGKGINRMHRSAIPSQVSPRGEEPSSRCSSGRTNLHIFQKTPLCSSVSSLLFPSSLHFSSITSFLSPRFKVPSSPHRYFRDRRHKWAFKLHAFSWLSDNIGPLLAPQVTKRAKRGQRPQPPRQRRRPQLHRSTRPRLLRRLCRLYRRRRRCLLFGVRLRNRGGVNPPPPPPCRRSFTANIKILIIWNVIQVVWAAEDEA